MTAVLLFTYPVILLFTLALWREIAGRNEYGDRPKWLLRSVIIFSVPMIFSVVFGFIYTPKSASFFAAQVLFTTPFGFIGAFLMEYSIHEQRIKNSFLMEDHQRTMGVPKVSALLIILLGVFGTLTALGVLSQRAISVRNYLIILALVMMAANIYILVGVFSFQKGVLRKKNYPFVAQIVLYLIAFILSLGRDFDGPILLLVPLLWNCTYLIRGYDEYFFRRSYHLHDAVRRSRESAIHNTDLINQIIVGSKDEDMAIIRSLIEDVLKKIEGDIILPQYKITGFALYRLKGDEFLIDGEASLFGYTTPLTEIENVKRLTESSLRHYLMDLKFNRNDLISRDVDSFRHFGEKMVREMLETSEILILEKIPRCYQGLQKLIALIPILNNEEITGFMLLFKDSFDKLFPVEVKQLQELAGNLNTVFSLVTGKEVQEERNRLEGEMNIAQEIQTSIIPKTIELEGYEIAADMVTATEVGGDAYDYFAGNGRHCFFIGDVAGHGLPSGVMSLIQLAAFHGALEASVTAGTELRADQIYDVTNRVLCLINRDRIGSDKFMTGNVMVEKNGEFIHAGTHEIALKYHKGEVSRIEGMVDKTAFLGLSELIQSETSLGRFSMESGDILVLYTDGVIEAKDRNDEQFGIHRLGEVIVANSELPSAELIGKIQESVLSFAQNGDIKRHNGSLADDLSLMVIRKQ